MVKMNLSNFLIWVGLTLIVYGMYLMKKINSFQIDDMEDVELINTILRNKK